MVDVSWFKGIIYNQDKIAILDDVMSPPYDIISPEMQNELYKKHKNNIVRLILGEQYPNDTKHSNRYTRAKNFFDLWLNNKVLKKVDKPAIYPYEIEYNFRGKKRTMNGFFMLLKLDPGYSFIKAHERTLSKPKLDRLNLIRTCQANFEPIELLYIDEKEDIIRIINESIGDAIIKVRESAGVIHTLWEINDERIYSEIKNRLKDKILFIADGHHRYQTAIDYSIEMKQKYDKCSNKAPFEYILVVLVNMNDKGLSILPTHRLLRLPDLNLNDFLEKLSNFFNVEERIVDLDSRAYSELEKEIIYHLSKKKDHRFILFYADRFFILTLKDEKIMDTFNSDHSKIWRMLDVSILHKIVIEHILGIDERHLEDYVQYTRSFDEAIKGVVDGRFTLSFLMNATRIEELKEVAKAGEHMPQKSTYFIPKMLSGLVMYKMEI
jgi:uncharacterized protein (DUF1015 family)